MNPETLRKVKTLAQDLENFLVATVDPEGQPHIAAAGDISFTSGGSLELTDWFCGETVNNLRKNPRIAVLLWDRGKDLGYQLIGTAELVEDVAMLDGYAPELDEPAAMPQVERRLRVRIDRILDFSQRGQGEREQ
jgi:predicted pyridoxine 5'-phosphate oxidase superfamily flavin-nucleotide-binding protein